MIMTEIIRFQLSFQRLEGKVIMRYQGASCERSVDSSERRDHTGLTQTHTSRVTDIVQIYKEPLGLQSRIDNQLFDCLMQ